MDEQLTSYVNGIFAPYEGVKSVAELKADLLSDLQERFRELKAEGKDDETAFAMTIESIGDIEQTVREVASLSHALERQVLINFNASNLIKSDFAGVILHKGVFKASVLRDSDVREANFAGANLTDCDFSTLDLADANFREAILVHTNFSKAGLVGAQFIGVKLTDVNFHYSDLRKTAFESCTFLGVDFHYSDLRGLRFDGQTFFGVTFDLPALKDASFQGATLKNVSFRPVGLWSSSKRTIQSIHFDGAMMDKLTYAALKGIGADVSNVTVL